MEPQSIERQVQLRALTDVPRCDWCGDELVILRGLRHDYVFCVECGREVAVQPPSPVGNAQFTGASRSS